jgi:multiple sugar transport system permease protein
LNRFTPTTAGPGPLARGAAGGLAVRRRAGGGKARRDWRWGMFFISPWLFGFVLLTLVPIALSFYYSLCDYSLLQPPAFIGLENYRALFRDPVFYLTLKNTFYYAAIALPAGMLLSVGTALMLNAPIRGQAIYRTIIFLPSLVPVVASAMVWLWLFNTKLGLINLSLGAIGIEGPAWLADPRWVLTSLALMSLWGIGHAVVIYIAGLQDIPAELYEAAEIDGAGVWRRLFSVTLPMLSPVIFFNLIMSIIGTLQVFAVPYIMTEGGPQRASYLYTHYLYDNAFGFFRMGYASAMAWLQLMIILALTGLAFWSSRRWVHYQGK